MNTTNAARRHLVERAAEMLDRDRALRPEATPVGLLQEPGRPAHGSPPPPGQGQVFAVPEGAPATMRQVDRGAGNVLEAPAPDLAAPNLAAPTPSAPTLRAREAPAPDAAARDVEQAPAARVAPAVSLAALYASGLLQPAEGQGRSRAIEEIAMVQHQVLRVMAEAPPEEAPRSHVLLIASALPREGRTFIALNLAATLATGGARSVVLVDADGRATSLTRSLGLEHRPGLCDMIAMPGGRAAEFALPTAVDRLHVLPFGMRRTAEGEPPPAATSAAAILRLAEAMPDHVIVLDPPPCLSTSDCTALASAAGQVVLVVDAQRTARDEVEAALDGLDACPVLQLLLNRAQLSSGSSFGAHYETADAQ